jgi:HSP20 family molecular chaperone IbpA
MDSRRIPISVSSQPSSIRLSSTSSPSSAQPTSDIRDKMNQRMREFEEESRKWREQFLNSSSNLNGGSSSSSSSILDRPRMFLNFPEFPELSPAFSSPLSTRLNTSNSYFPTSSALLPTPSSFAATTSHKSFIEEDDHGQKKFKITFDIGDFKPNEIQVKTDGRQLIVKGEREVVAGTASESKQFNREISLPDFVEPRTVQSFLSDGVLTVEAPVILDRLSLGGAPTTHSTVSTSSSSVSSKNPSAAAPIAHSTASASAAPQLRSNLNEPVLYKFNMSEFRPEDIAITVTDTTLKIHAVREERDYNSSGNTYREFKREIGLPHGADVQRLKNALQSDGMLVIEIPLSNPSSNNNNNNLTKSFNNLSFSDDQHHQQQHHHQSNQSRLLSNSSTSSAAANASASSVVNNGGLVNTVNDGKDLRLTFDLTGYKPEDLSIKVIDNNTLKIHAVHIDNTRGNQIHREYTR